MSLNTDTLLQQPPFNLTDEADRSAFMALAKELDIGLDAFLLGTIFKKECKDSPAPYTDEEIDAIAKDLVNIYERSFSGRSPSHTKKDYTLTFGAPLVGKSFYMESKLVDSSNVYVDPDRQALQFMDCYQELANKDRKLAYETYRDASNYICNLLLVWAIFKGYSIAHGTTGTNPRVAKSILPTLKRLGYTIHAHVLFADAESRKPAGTHRNEHQKFYQSTPGDEKGKVAPVFTRIKDAIIPYADTADFYWNTGTYWLNTTPEQSDTSLRKFASFNRELAPTKIVGDTKSLDILERLSKQVVEEIPAKAEQDEVIAMFNSWFVKPEVSTKKNYLPGFNRYTAAAAATLTIGVLAVAAAYLMQDDDSSAPKLKPFI